MSAPLDFQLIVLSDIFGFGRMIDAYAAKAHLRAHNKASTRDQRRLHFVSLHGALINAYETMAAVLLGMRDSNDQSLFDTLLTYGVGTASLSTMMDGVADVYAFCRRFRIDPNAVRNAGEYTEAEWDEWIAEVVRSIRSSAIDQTNRLAFYNKTKHGKVIVRVNGHLSALHYPNRDTDLRLESHTVRYHRGQARILFNLAVKVSHATGDLILLHFASKYPDEFHQIRESIENDWRTHRLRPIQARRQGRR